MYYLVSTMQTAALLNCVADKLPSSFKSASTITLTWQNLPWVTLPSYLHIFITIAHPCPVSGADYVNCCALSLAQWNRCSPEIDRRLPAVLQPNANKEHASKSSFKAGQDQPHSLFLAPANGAPSEWQQMNKKLSQQPIKQYKQFYIFMKGQKGRWRCCLGTGNVAMYHRGWFRMA